MSRPQPRRSQLAGMGAVTPSQETEKDVPASAETPGTEVPSDATTEKHATPAARNPDGTRKSRHKIAVYMTEDEANRARAAMVETSIPSREGPRSWSKFVVDAVLKETARLERKYNDGEQWPPVEAWQIPQGRPTGSRTRKNK